MWSSFKVYTLEAISDSLLLNFRNLELPENNLKAQSSENKLREPQILLWKR